MTTQASQQNQRFASSAMWVLLARVMAFVSIFGIMAVVARAFPPELFGAFALFFSLLGLTSLVGTLGLNRALVKIIAEEQVGDELTVLLRRLIGYTILISTAIGAALGLLAGYYLDQPSWIVAWLVGAIVVLRSLQLLLGETLRGFHEQRWSNFFGGLSGGPLTHLIWLVALLALWWLNELTVVSLLSSFVLVLVITTAALMRKAFQLALSRTTSPNNNKASDNKTSNTDSPAGLPEVNSSEVLALSIPLMFTQVFGLAFSQADLWLASALASGSLAIYASAQRLLSVLTVPLQISNTAIVSIIPELKSKQQTQDLQHIVGVAATASVIPAFIAAAIFFCYAETILSTIFGDFYAQSANLLRVLTVGQLICVITGPSEIVLMMTGHQNLTWRINLGFALVTCASGVFALLNFGLLGLAIAVSASLACQNILTWYFAKRLVGIRTNCFSTSIDLSLFQRVRRRFSNQTKKAQRAT